MAKTKTCMIDVLGPCDRDWANDLSPALRSLQDTVYSVDDYWIEHLPRWHADCQALLRRMYDSGVIDRVEYLSYARLVADVYLDYLDDLTHPSNQHLISK